MPNKLEQPIARYLRCRIEKIESAALKDEPALAKSFANMPDRSRRKIMGSILDRRAFHTWSVLHIALVDIRDHQ